MRAPRARTQACVALALLALGTAARAEEPRPIVALEFAGSDVDRDAFTASLRELLLRLGIELAPRRTDAPLPKESLLAVVAADWSAPTEASVTITDAGGRVVLLRRLSRSGSAPLVIEAASHISQSVLEELVAAKRASRVPVLSAPLEVAAAQQALPPPETPGRIGLEVGGFFGGRALGGGASIAVGAGLLIDVSLASRFRPALWVLGGYTAPIEIRTDLVQLSVNLVPLRAGGAATLFSGESWRVDLGLGAGTDLLFSAPRSGVLPPNRLGRPRLDATPVLTALLSGKLAVARAADVSLSFTLDVDLMPRRFIANVGPAQDEIFVPWRMRPALVLGFSFSPLGPEPYAHRVGGEP